MTEAHLRQLEQRYQAYVATFRTADGTLPEMLQLKLEHTYGVVADARRIMEGEQWHTRQRLLGEAGALLHDVGRYSQLREFGTFQDDKSINHAQRGVEIIQREAWLAELPVVERTLLLECVRLHNVRELPPDLDEATALLATLVRDADKLDIFRVMDKAAADGSFERTPEIAWGLQIKGAPSPVVVECVCAGHTVRYEQVRTLADFVLIQVGWLNGGLRFRTTCRLAIERGTLELRERFLKTLTDDPSVDRCCRIAGDYLERLTHELT